MNPNRFLLFISFLIMCKLSIVASKAIPPVTDSGNKCSNVSTPLDAVNISNFRSNVQQELKRWNCTNYQVPKIPEAHFENPAITSEIFCTSLVQSKSWKSLNATSYPNLDHLMKKIFPNRTLCLVVCTNDLNETLWPSCGALLEAFAEKNPEKSITPPAGLEAGNKVIAQPINAKNSRDRVQAGQSNSVKDVQNAPPKPNDSVGSPNGDLVNAADLIPNQKTESGAVAPPPLETPGAGSKKNQELFESEIEDQPQLPDDGPLNGVPSKTETMSNSMKNTSQKETGNNSPKETVNASNQSGKNLAAPVNMPSKSLPRTAIGAGTSNLRPENDESHYFIYFVVVSILCIFCYVGIYNKKKILALMIEGRKQKDRRRHASAGYRKLNTNLEEVMPLGTPAPANDTMIY